MIAIYDCQILVQEEEEDEDDEDDEYEIDEEAEIPRAELNRQVGKRQQFTLYEKMAEVRQIQWHIEVSNLRFWAAFQAPNLHHKQFIT